MEYVTKKGDRYEPVLPQDSNILGSDRTMLLESHTKAEYKAKAGDRYEIERPQPSELWKKDGIMESMTVNRAEYSAKTGEREPHHVPQDSNFLKSDERFNGETHFAREFQPKTGERAEIRKPEISDIWKTEGTMESSSVHRQEYAPKPGGERYEPMRPKDSDIFQHQGSFIDETHAELEPKKGERFETKRPETSDIWKKEGVMDGISVTQDEFTHKTSEKSGMHYPIHSLTLGEHTDEAVSRSVTHDDFQQKFGERYSPIRGYPSDLSFGDSNALFDGRTLTQDDFGLKTVEKSQPIRHSSQIQIDHEASFDTNTVYQETYQGSPGVHSEKAKSVRPSTALKLAGERELISAYEREFHNKMEPCIAGELVDSVKKGHSVTAHFEFEKVDKGHHLYKSKAGVDIAIN
ncbi:hypothetical protein Ddc_00963 [Ditylenchus destructor]|nr:hypothetical protein Ddc_00963 [Ditylenchus destructor]